VLLLGNGIGPQQFIEHYTGQPMKHTGLGATGMFTLVLVSRICMCKHVCGYTIRKARTELYDARDAHRARSNSQVHIGDGKSHICVQACMWAYHLQGLHRDM
jgi:hypothetical protein